jgi:hypothetical protein
MKSFVIPRGVSVLAGATVEPGAKSFKLSASLGSPTFGICSNPFLDREFQTVGFEVSMTLPDENNFSYEQVTRIRIKGQEKIFEHRDVHRLQRVQK